MYVNVEALNIKLVDTLNRIPTSLANFPRTFGI